MPPPAARSRKSFAAASWNLPREIMEQRQGSAHGDFLANGHDLRLGRSRWIQRQRRGGDRRTGFWLDHEDDTPAVRLPPGLHKGVERHADIAAGGIGEVNAATRDA